MGRNKRDILLNKSNLLGTVTNSLNFMWFSESACHFDRLKIMPITLIYFLLFSNEKLPSKVKAENLLLTICPF